VEVRVGDGVRLAVAVRVAVAEVGLAVLVEGPLVVGPLVDGRGVALVADVAGPPPPPQAARARQAAVAATASRSGVARAALT
jgi:hypothetical protein